MKWKEGESAEGEDAPFTEPRYLTSLRGPGNFLYALTSACDLFLCPLTSNQDLEAFPCGL